MKDNGTDRDVALLILAGLDSCATLVSSINDNLYVPHIITQPTDQTGAVGDTANFTVVANNVSAYQWQYKTSASTEWHDSTTAGNNTDTLELPILEQRYGYYYRCKITGKDGSIIYSNPAQLLRPEAQG